MAPGDRAGTVGTALVPPDDADDDALDHDIALVYAQRGHGRIRRLQPDPAAGLAIELLDRGAGPVHQGDHRLTVVGLAPLVHDDVVAVLDVLVDHRLAPDFEDVASAATRHELVGHGDRIGARYRLDRRSGGDQAEQRQVRRPRLAFGWHDLDRATLVVRAVDVAFALEV